MCTQGSIQNLYADLNMNMYDERKTQYIRSGVNRNTVQEGQSVYGPTETITEKLKLSSKPIYTIPTRDKLHSKLNNDIRIPFFGRTRSYNEKSKEILVMVCHDDGLNF